MTKNEFPKPENMDSKELSREELKNALSQLKKEYCQELDKSLGIVLIFPEGTVIANQDFSGKTLEYAFNYLIGAIENYEPPVFTGQLAEEMAIEQVETPKEVVPTWLEGHEELVWHGTLDSPLWKVNGKQIADEVVVSYSRRDKELRSGRGKTEQSQELETAKYTFSLPEWQVADQVFKTYNQMEEIMNQPGESEEKKKVQAKYLEILHEENAYRPHPKKIKFLGLELGLDLSEDSGAKKERVEPSEPKAILRYIEQAIEELAKRRRDFNKDSIDPKKLTQQVADILSQIVVLNHNRGNGRERIPKAKPEIKETPTFQAGLKKLSECFATQANFKTEAASSEKKPAKARGITLLMGEAGTGKNEVAEYFSAKTKRPYFWFPCGRGMEAIDLVTHYEFDSKEGTKRFMTDLAEGIQTPGAVVLLDEVNSLKSEVQAILHGLGDSNRALKYDGVNIPVAEGVLIIIAGNPATYGSAGDFGQALLNRNTGQSMIMEYPALTKGELVRREEMWTEADLTKKEQEDNTLRDYACDEVLVMYPQLNEFSNLTDQQFSLLWDVVINEERYGVEVTKAKADPVLKSLLEQGSLEHISKTLKDLRDILRVVDAWRKEYLARRGGFDILAPSMRDTIALVKEYKNSRDVKKTFLKTFSHFQANPIDGLDSTYKSLERLINNTLSSVS